MLFILGLGLFVVGTLWMLMLAFRASIWWGLGCLFIPFVQLFYLFSHWKEAGNPAGLQVLGMGIMYFSVKG